MKIDRLLGITIFLLNNGKASARVLAEKYEVSQRTIQRDIEAINMAGIPIVSTFGADGGYEILDSFRMERQAASDNDYAYILTALKGLSTAYDNPKIDATIEKILAVTQRDSIQPSIFLDFSVLREGRNTLEWLNLLEDAIANKVAVSFDYTNSEGITRSRVVESLALTYKWYSWYLFGFCTAKKDYRLFKLVRMENLLVSGQPFSKEHERVDLLMKKHESADQRKVIDIRLLCKPEIKMLVQEYLNGHVVETRENGDFVLEMQAPENEHLWFGTLLALGNQAVVLEPDSLRQRLCKKAQAILELYKKYDI